MTELAEDLRPNRTADCWQPVCRYDQLEPERGVAALIASVQVAIFRTFDGALYALSNRDPVTGANVLSRGIVGTRGTIPTVASPLLKQVYDLRTGSCLDDRAVGVPTYPIRVVNDLVEVCYG